VLLCRYGGLRFLLTGDIGSAAIARLMQQYEGSLHAEVLLMPHHGIYTVDSLEFAAAARPAVALASCAAGDDVEESRDALEGLNVPFWTTAREGALIVELARNELTVEGFKSKRRATFNLPAGSNSGKLHRSQPVGAEADGSAGLVPEP